MEILTVKDLSFTYPLATAKTLDSISFTVERGDFVAVCGPTGSGKSTLLRLLKHELAPLGEKSGQVCYLGQPVETLDCRISAAKIGYVAQQPEQQIVTDKVWHELAFGLENIGVAQKTACRRVAEMSAYFGIEQWYEKRTAELSGGQKQLLSLAAVMVMQPDVLILDEPTAQLDPIAASEFITTLQKLNRELSLTIIITEHRLEEIIPAANKLLAVSNGQIVVYGRSAAAAAALAANPEMQRAMPTALRLYSALDGTGKPPLTVREGRDYIEANFSNKIISTDKPAITRNKKPALEFRDVYFRYGRHLPDVLRGLTLTVYEGEICCIVGGNGAGKSTALLAAAGIARCYSGCIKAFGKRLGEYKGQELYSGCVSYLAQDVQTVFLMNTVREELAEVGAQADSLPFDLTSLLDRHPYDLSGGEQQLVALAKALAKKPRLLLLDEPTKGIDAAVKQSLGETLRKLRDNGMTIVCVTHDVEFAAEISDRCVMLFRGEATSVDDPHTFFSENNFYTTAASRMTRDYYSGVITVEEAVSLCQLNGRRCV